MRLGRGLMVIDLNIGIPEPKDNGSWRLSRHRGYGYAAGVATCELWQSALAPKSFFTLQFGPSCDRTAWCARRWSLRLL